MKREWHQCPTAVSHRCIARAWDDSCPDRERVLLEAASNTIERLMMRLTAQAKVLEVVEAELDRGRYPLLDDDDPGVAL